MSQEQKRSEALEALQRIKEAEEEARRIIEEAQQRAASNVIRDAYEEAKKIKENHLNQTRKRALEKKNSLISEAEREAEKIKKETAEEAQAISRKAEAFIPRVVEEFARKIRNFLI
jgi:vacuolar-type H+-ATPase subunit H